ncbi:MAG TPA: EAL domain-containing protein [Candidatus Cybelea sp.]|nr:EAL domain-containing protein [Candidatus Cybelea sp.]
MTATKTEVLRRDRDRFVGFAFASADLLLELDSRGRIQWAGGAVRSILDVEPEQARGMQLSKLFEPQDAELLDWALRGLERGQRRRDIDLALRGNGGVPRPIRSCVYRALDPTAPEYLLSISLRPGRATEQTRARQRDRATGLIEAVEFAETTANAVRAARDAGKSACLTLVQICGEAELDRLLGPERARALMSEIGTELRSQAIAVEAAAKLGDGKFSVAHLADRDPVAITEAISRVGDSYEIDSAALKVTETTIKFPTNSLGDDDVEGILGYILEKFRADGTAGVEGGSADAYLRKMTAETLSRVVMMRDVIHERRLTLVYQPIVGLSDRVLHHYEVLLRFADGQSPFDDIRFAEQINTIHEVDLAVAQGATKRLQQATADRQELSLAVNMSARSLLNESFLAMFDEVAARLGPERKRLIIEVTESAKLEELERAARAVDWLTEKGHPICLDDFGAGASSLPYLQQLTVCYVKIDGAYVRGITEGGRERAIIQGVLATCKCLGISTVAEMIEREDQHQCLLGLGVDLGQGWLYGRPVAEIPGERAPIKVPRRMDPKAVSRLLTRGGAS